MPMGQSMMPMMGMMRQMQQMMDQMHQMMGGAAVTATMPATGTAASEPMVDLTQTAQAGDVTVQVTALNLDDAQAETLDFQVVLDTHSVDIDVDLAETAVLRTGETEVAPAVWESDSPAGHHVAGVLRFARQEIPDDEALTLTIGGLPGDEEATFTWAMNR
jgi:hypothetical protein